MFVMVIYKNTSKFIIKHNFNKYVKQNLINSKKTMEKIQLQQKSLKLETY